MCMIMQYTYIIMKINVLHTLSIQKKYDHCAYTQIVIKKFNDKSFKMYFLREQF